jgi:hypothetical protein
VRSHFTRVATVGTITPSMTIPEGTDQTVDNKTLTIDQTASVKIPWTGEDVQNVNNGAASRRFTVTRSRRRCGPS